MRLYIVLFFMVLTSINAVPMQAKPQSVTPLAGTILAWTMEPWNNDDKFYEQTRQSVFDAMQKTQKPSDLVATYKAEAQQQPRDPKAVFRYAYATFQATLRDPAFRKTSELYKANRASQMITPTRNYQFARLTFLMEAEVGGYKRALLPLGERLIHRDPADIQVKYWLVKILDGANFPQDAEKQKKYALDLVHAYPKTPGMYATLGSTYFGVWTRTKSALDKEQALAAFQKYLHLAPPNDEYRSHVQFTIKWLQQGQVPTHLKN